MAAKTTTKAQTRAAKPKKKAERSPTSNRAVWKGAITFGLITIPVGLFAAVEERTIAFHQLHAADLSRIRYQRVCSKEGKEVPYEEIVKGYEFEKDRYVVFTDEELDRGCRQAREFDVASVCIKPYAVRRAADSALVVVMRPSRLLLFTQCELGLCGLQFTERFFPVSFEGTGNKPIIGIDSHISTLSILRFRTCPLDREAQRRQGIVAFLPS